MIDVYIKILNTVTYMVSRTSIPISCNSSTIHNKFMLSSHTFHYDLRKYSFIPRIVDIWNGLALDMKVLGVIY